MVSFGAQGDLSDAGRDGRQFLRGLTSVPEAFGLVAYIVDRIVGQVSLDERDKVAFLTAMNHLQWSAAPTLLHKRVIQVLAFGAGGQTPG